MSARRYFFMGAAVVIALVAIWHGPIGSAGPRYVALTEARAAHTIGVYAMDDRVAAMVERGPVKRRIWLAGQADKFQSEKLAELMDRLPAVADSAWWRPDREPVRTAPVLPLLAEIELLALALFGFGFLIAYLHALRRHARRFAVI